MKTAYIRNFIIGITCIFYAETVSAQIPTFKKTYGGTGKDFGHALAATPDGGFILTGQTQSYGDTCGDVYILKTDAAGNVEWNRVIAGTKLEGGNSIVCCRDGGYFITCHTESFGAGECDSWIIKTDDKGTALWNRLYGGTGDDVGEQGIETADGSFIICGVERSLNPTGNAFLTKYSSDGTLLWSNTYGGANAEIGYRITETADLGYVVSGVTLSNSNGPVDLFVFKTDRNGNLLWQKNLGGAGIDEGYGILSAPDGGLVICGFSRSFGSGDEDGWILKMDDSGNQLWSRNYGGLFSDKLFSATAATDGGYVFTGQTGSFGDSLAAWMIKTDMFGNMIWMKTFGGIPKAGVWITSSSDGGNAILGTEYKNDSRQSDFLLIKTDENGNISTGVPEITRPPYFTVSPNPANNHIHISYPDLYENSEVTVTDILGKNLISVQNQSDLDISHLEKGIYFINLRKGESLLTAKFMKD